MSINTIMTADESGAEMVKFAEQTAQTLVKNNLTRSQIRNIFTEVRKIEAIWNIRSDEALRRLNMLRPKLSYQSSRTASFEVLQNVLIAAIEEVEKASEDKRNQRFQRFVELFEAILAYHRAMGGRN